MDVKKNAPNDRSWYVMSTKESVWFDRVQYFGGVILK